MPNQPETLLSTRRFFVERVWHAGQDGQPYPREIVRHPGAVTILPVVDDERICLIRNYRCSVDEQLIELPAGTLEPDEDPATTAARELAEETGYRAEHLEQLVSFYLSPGILDERMHLFLAKNLTPGAARREPNERIENLVVRWCDALEMVRDGQIRDAKTMVGLLFYEQWRGTRSP
jgi:ADP-ribose pyrophosphatase